MSEAGFDGRLRRSASLIYFRSRCGLARLTPFEVANPPTAFSIVGSHLGRSRSLPLGPVTHDACGGRAALGRCRCDRDPFVVVDLKSVPDGHGLIGEADFLTVGVAQNEFVERHSSEFV